MHSIAGIIPVSRQFNQKSEPFQEEEEDDSSEEDQDTPDMDRLET